MFTSEIISIGQELLNGSTINTNANFLALHLKDAGFTVQRQTAIPDNKEIILETIAESLACTNLVIITGGLGPTVDDVTREAISELLQAPLIYNEEYASQLLSRFGAIDGLENQATLPQGAFLFPNTCGTAAGLCLVKGQALLIALPGVPLEMQLMMKNQVLPYLKTIFPKAKSTIKLKLYFHNLYEATVDPVLRKAKLDYPGLEIGIYPHHSLLTIHLEGKNAPDAKEKILSEFQANSYDASDGKIETALQDLFIQKGWTLSVAESCTGGALSARLASIPGASAYFLGGIVAYSNDLKENLLDVPRALLEEKGAVSKETANALAESIQKKTGSTFSISVTGIAGPAGGSATKPIGTVFVSLKKANTPAISLLLEAKGERPAIIEHIVNFALGKLYGYII